MGWTENPADPQAVDLDKFKGQALAALDRPGCFDKANLAADRISPGAASARGARRPAGPARVPPVRPERRKGEGGARCGPETGARRYRAVPGAQDGSKPLTLPGVPNLRIYVLGPPRSQKMLGIRERAGEMYGLGGTGGWPMAYALDCALDAASGAAEPADDSVGAVRSPRRRRSGPDRRFKAGAKSDGDERGSRRVRAPALRRSGGEGARRRQVETRRSPTGEARSRRGAASTTTGSAWPRDLAIQLDDRTNNSSLVLAFEFADSGRVLLFTARRAGRQLAELAGPHMAGRRQDGHRPRSSRAHRLYKVGHHGSHNATLRQKGLELMTRCRSVGFHPDQRGGCEEASDGVRCRFGDIVDELNRRGSKRVDPRRRSVGSRTDKVDARFKAPSGSIQAVRHKKNLWVEIDIA